MGGHSRGLAPLSIEAVLSYSFTAKLFLLIGLPRVNIHREN